MDNKVLGVNEQNSSTRARLAIGLVVGLLVVTVVFVLFSSNSQLNLITVSPAPGSMVSSEETVVTFEFNNELSSASETETRVFVTPNTDYTFSVEGRNIIVYMTDLIPLDNVEYLVVVEGVVDSNGSTTEAVSTTFNVDIPDRMASFVGSLPYLGDGYRIDLYSNELILVTITDTQYSKSSSAADAYLGSAGLDSAVFNVVFEPNYSSFENNPNEQLFPEGE
jgi:hypothetical protein